MTICKINYNLRCHVPFWGILVFGKSLLPFLGDAINRVFGGKMGLMHVQKSGFLVFWKKLFPKTAQNGPKRHAHVPFLDILVFGKRLLSK